MARAATSAASSPDRISLRLDRRRLDLLRSRRDFCRDEMQATFARLSAMRLELTQEEQHWWHYCERACRTRDVQKRPLDRSPAELGWAMEGDIVDAYVDQAVRGEQQRNAAEAADREAAIRRKWGAQLGPLVEVQQLGVQEHEQRAHDLKIERLTADIADAEQHHEQRRERFTTCSSVLQAVEQFLAGRSGGELPDLVVDVDPRLAGASLDELRAQLPPIEAEREAIRRAPRPIEEAVERLRQSIAEAGRRSGLQVEHLVSPDSVPSLQMRGSAPIPGFMSHTAAELAAWLRPDELQAAGEKQIRLLYKQIPQSGPGAPVTAARRTELLSEIEMKSRSVQYAEEVSLRNAWTSRHSGPDHRVGARAELALAVIE